MHVSPGLRKQKEFDGNVLASVQASTVAVRVYLRNLQCGSSLDLGFEV